MRARFFCLLAVVALTMLISCQDSSVPRGYWVPEIEETGFGYLRDIGGQVKTAVQLARVQLSEGKTSDAMDTLTKAEDEMKLLVYYDIPITEARQLVYDASRLHAMERHEDSLAHLDRAERVLNTITAHGTTMVVETLQKILTMVDELQGLLGEEQRMTSPKLSAEGSLKVAAKFQELGHKINMMAIKSDLVLSGAHFND